MKLKNKIVSLTLCLSFCLVTIFNIVYFGNKTINTHETVLKQTDINYMSLLEEFDEKELVIEGNNVKLEAIQYLEEDFFDIIDNVSMEKKFDTGSITYDIDYKGDENVFVLKTIAVDVYGNETITETEGAAFINENNEIDAIFVDEEENVLLSELTGGNVENCGFFSRLKKALKKVAVAVAVVAVAAVVVAAVAACPAVGVLVTTTGQTVLAVTGTIGSAALVSGALTTAAVAGTAALATYGLSQAIYDSYVGTDVMTTSIKDTRALSKTIIATLTAGYTLSLNRDYNIAYVAQGQVIIERGVSLNYIEALSVLVAAGFLNGMTFPKGMTLIGKNNFSTAMNELLKKIEKLNISAKLIGIYTYDESDAAKLAYACGGFFKGKFESENHSPTKGSGHYYHFHDAMHLIHVFYGNPS